MMKKIAKMSPHARYQHCSLIFAGSRLLAYGYNREGIHSEIVAINRLNALLRNDNSKRPRNLHMINLMIKKKNGKLGNSCPCDNCMAAIMSSNIKTVTYLGPFEVFEQIEGYN